MEHVQREPRPEPAPGAPAVGRGVSPGPAAPDGAAAGWERLPLPARAARGGPAPPRPIVLSVSHGARARSWAIDPGLLLIAGVALAAIGLGALDRLLVALLSRLF
jgi:hypothetical protein